MTDRKYRIVGLDILRVGLTLLIFMFHSHIHLLHCSYGIFDDFVNMGAIAMTGFFMLSGYSIQISSGSKDMTNTVEIKQFFTKRLSAILPLYYVYAILNITYNILQKGQTAVIEEIVLFPIEFLSIQSFFSGLFPYSHNGGSWFISCILFCYLIYPLIQLLTKNITDKQRLWIITTFSFILLYGAIIVQKFKLEWIYDNPLFRCQEFIIGVLICQVNSKQETDLRIFKTFRKSTACVLTVAIMIIGITIASRLNIRRDYMLYSWISLPCFISLLISLGHIKFGQLQNSNLLGFLSSISFSFYLTQIMFLWIITKKITELLCCDSNLLKVAVSFVLCFMTAIIIHKFIEIPSSKLLKQKYLK